MFGPCSCSTPLACRGSMQVVPPPYQDQGGPFVSHVNGSGTEWSQGADYLKGLIQHPLNSRGIFTLVSKGFGSNPKLLAGSAALGRASFVPSWLHLLHSCPRRGDIFSVMFCISKGIAALSFMPFMLPALQHWELNWQRPGNKLPR